MTGVVVGTVDVGENDRILTLLTRESGRLSARARGARRSARRFAGRTDLFCLVHARLTGAADRLVLVDVDLVEPFLGLRERLEAMALASYATELATAATPEGHAQPRVFGLLVEALAVLAEPGAPIGAPLARAFELALLDAAGLMPVLGACVACGGLAVGDRVALSTSAGGVLCADHAWEDPGASRLTGADLQHLRALAAGGLAGEAVAGAPAPERDARERDALRAFLDGHLGRRPRSAGFLDRVAWC